MAVPAQFVIDNTNNQVLEWGGLVDGISAIYPPLTFINDATVTATLYQNRVINDPTQLGTVVASFGTSGVLTLAYVAASQGLYRGTLLSSFAIAAGANYVLVIDAANASGYQGHWEIPTQVTTRRQ